MLYNMLLQRRVFRPFQLLQRSIISNQHIYKRGTNNRQKLMKKSVLNWKNQNCHLIVVLLVCFLLLRTCLQQWFQLKEAFLELHLASWFFSIYVLKTTTSLSSLTVTKKPLSSVQIIRLLKKMTYRVTYRCSDFKFY